MSLVILSTWGIASASATLALMHLRIWWSDRSAWANAAFALVAVGVALFATAEYGLMRADTPERFGQILRWAHVPIFMMLVGILWFVRAAFHRGRTWLACATAGVNALTLLVNFLQHPNVDLRVLNGLARVPYLGETVSIPVGQASAWHWMVQFSLLLLLVFVADASLSAWRAGGDTGRRAAVFGITYFGFVVIGALQAALLYGGLRRAPHLVALSSFPVLVLMGYDLSGEVLRAARVTRQLRASEASLRESERRMSLVAAEAQRLSGRLIDAQEDERRRIARELHDDLSQRLAVVSVQLDLLRRSGDHAMVGVASERIAAEVRSLASEVHAISHRLHPAKLEQLGLETAVRAWCRDLTAQAGLPIACEVEGVPRDLESQVALCMYRLVQETTRNVVRHSGARSASVKLSAGGDALHLVVADTGRGFDPVGARAAAGLGLVSMRERVRTLEGTLSIESQPGGGTRVTAMVPALRAGVRGTQEAARTSSAPRHPAG
jgi:signal transduction histidine kinase